MPLGWRASLISLLQHYFAGPWSLFFFESQAPHQLRPPAFPTTGIPPCSPQHGFLSELACPHRSLESPLSWSRRPGGSSVLCGYLGNPPGVVRQGSFCCLLILRFDISPADVYRLRNCRLRTLIYVSRWECLLGCNQRVFSLICKVKISPEGEEWQRE